MDAIDPETAKTALLAERARLLGDLEETIIAPRQMTYGSQAAAATQQRVADRQRGVGAGRDDDDQRDAEERQERLHADALHAEPACILGAKRVIRTVLLSLFQPTRNSGRRRGRAMVQAIGAAGGPVPRHDGLDPIETASRDALQALQLERLRWSLRHAYENVAHYRRAFDGFDPKKVARYDRRKIQKLLGDPGIVRNKLKIASTVENAKAFLRVQEEFGSFDKYIWQFVGGKPIKNSWREFKHLPASTTESDAMSKDLKKRGFTFVGSTICYAFMQAVGMVNDHMIGCFRRNKV